MNDTGLENTIATLEYEIESQELLEDRVFFEGVDAEERMTLSEEKRQLLATLRSDTATGQPLD